LSRLKDQHASIWEGLKQKSIPIIRPVPTDRYKNKWERDFAHSYLDPLVHSGILRGYCYECIKLRLADGAFYCPDFFAPFADEVLAIYEVKGWLREAARLRFLVARDLFPQFQWHMMERKAGQWQDRKV